MGSPPRGGFPKLLVVAEFGPSSLGGGEALVRQLLKGYPAERVGWWSCSRPGAQVGEPITRNHWCYPFPPRLYPNRRLSRLKSWILERAWVPGAQRHLRGTLADWGAEQVWLQLFGWGIPIAGGVSLTRHPRCHASFWDFPDSNSKISIWGPARSGRFLALAETLYRTAQTCDAISQPMWDELAARTGRRDGVLVHSGLEPEQLRELEGAASQPSAEIRIAYAGTIVVESTFRKFVAALEQMRCSLSKPLALEFFGARRYSDAPWFQPSWMRENVGLDDRQFQTALAKCTWGFVGMDLTDEDPRYNRYSFPNKFGSYLAAGLPLIVIGHRESSAVKMMSAYRVGVCSAAADDAALVEFLLDALSEGDPKSTYRSEILRCARTEFNAEAMRQKLWACLGVRTAEGDCR